VSILSNLAIPVITPRDVQYLLKYLSGIDEALSRRFSLGFLPDEEHLTSLLCELLDAQGSSLHALPYTIGALNDDLKNANSLLQASITLETTPYNKYQERRFTQADIGVVAKYVDNISPSYSFTKGLLAQAKKLFPAHERTYSLHSKYSSFNPEQHERLASLSRYYLDQKRRLGKEPRRDLDRVYCGSVAAYLLYNPPVSALPRLEQEVVAHRQLRHDSGKIFDYLHGLHLYHELRGSNATHPLHNGGSIFVSLDDIHRLALNKSNEDGEEKEKLVPFELGALSESVDLRLASLPWFLVFEFLLGSAGCMDSEFLELVKGNAPGMAKELRFSAPRFVLQIEISAGTRRQG